MIMTNNYELQFTPNRVATHLELRCNSHLIVLRCGQAIDDEGRQLFTKTFDSQEELFKCMDRNESGSLSEQEFQVRF